VYTLERKGVASSSSLTDDEVAEITKVIDFALDHSYQDSAQGAVARTEWTAAKWLDDSLSLGGLVGRSLVHRLGGRSAELPGLERGFIVGLGRRGGKQLVKGLLLESDLVGEVCDCIWPAVQRLAEEAMPLDGTVSTSALRSDASAPGGGHGEDLGFGDAAIRAVLRSPPRNAVRDHVHSGSENPNSLMRREGLTAKEEQRQWAARQAEKHLNQHAPDGHRAGTFRIPGSPTKKGMSPVSARVAERPLAPLHQLAPRQQMGAPPPPPQAAAPRSHSSPQYMVPLTQPVPTAHAVPRQEQLRAQAVPVAPQRTEVSPPPPLHANPQAFAGDDGPDSGDEFGYDD
jgi:hypothetical protein